MQIISDMIWPSTRAFDLHLQSTGMISIVTGVTPWSPSSWSPSSCRHRGCRAPTMLLLLLLPFSDKVKHYKALNDWHAGHTKIKDNPMAPAGCRIHRHASRYQLLQHDHLIHQIYLIMSLAISYHIHTLQKQVRRPLICCCMFYVAAMGI